MRIRPLFLAAIVAAIGFAPGPGEAQVTDPNALAPYRFVPPPSTLSPLEQQKALRYRSEIQNQLRQLEQQRALGGPNAVKPWDLQDTRRELDRMNEVVRP